MYVLRKKIVDRLNVLFRFYVFFAKEVGYTNYKNTKRTQLKKTHIHTLMEFVMKIYALFYLERNM